jgi:hypothetical protein
VPGPHPVRRPDGRQPGPPARLRLHTLYNLYNPPLRPTRSLEIMVPSTLTTGALCPTRTTMVLMLVHLQGAAVIFRVGRHHHRGPFCEGRGLTHALTDTAPTDLTVAYASPLGAQPQSDRILRVMCGRLVPGAHSMPLLDALKRACRRSSLQASRSARSALSGCCGRC